MSNQVSPDQIPKTFLKYAETMLSSFPSDSPNNAYSYGFMDLDSSGQISDNSSIPLKAGNPTAEAGYYNQVHKNVLANKSWPYIWGVWGNNADSQLDNNPTKQPAAGYFGSPDNPLVNPFVLTDCSGFVNHVVSTVTQNPAYAAPAGTNNYYQADDYASGSSLDTSLWQHYTVVENPSAKNQIGIADIQPNDILAWSLPPGNQDTGHVMIVAETPTGIRPVNPQIAYDGVYYIKVYDCSDITHVLDNRPNGTGLGTGYISLKYGYDPNGDPAWIASVGGYMNISSGNSLSTLAVLRLA